ncbi:MAG TPA: hypothetical protein PKX12_09500 [Spirochaetota bacterium]|nr:hypothetical protein [Spirochaetota bacterium]
MIKASLLILAAQMCITSAFTFRESGPATLFPYYTAAADDGCIFETFNPAYLPMTPTPYCTMNYSRPYSIRELEAGSARAGFSTARFGFQGGWCRFGIDEYMEDTFEAMAGAQIVSGLFAGIGYSWYRQTIGTEDLSSTTSLSDFRGAVAVTPFHWITVSVLQENLYTLAAGRENDLLYPATSGGIALRPVRGITFTWNVNRDYYGSINTFMLSAHLLPCLSFRAGYSRETTSWGAAAAFTHGRVRFSYGLRYHSRLGSTHIFGATFTGSPAPFTPVRYGTRFLRKYLPEKNRKQKKMNIQSASADELKAIVLFREKPEILKRIIAFRSISGPVSEKALYQTGLDGSEVMQLKERITGLAPDISPRNIGPDQKHTAARRRNHSRSTETFYSLQRRRALFQRLIGAGIRSTTALRISERAKTLTKQEFLARVRQDTELDDDTRQKVIRACRDL